MKSKKLADTLMAMFSAEELRRLLQFTFGPEVTSELPAAHASLATLAYAVVEVLERRELVGEQLFAALRRERPRRRAEIDAVEALWADGAAAAAPVVELRPAVPRAAAFEWLPRAEFLAVYNAALNVVVGGEGPFNALVDGIMPGYLASISIGGSMNVRLLTLLQKLNGCPNLSDGTIPLARMLENGSLLTIGQPAEQVFTQALERVQRGRGGVPAPPRAVATDEELRGLTLEAVVGRADLTESAMFLIRGATAARSVARLLVHRHFDGAPSIRPGEVPDYAQGTGWLIAPDLIVTNHHVLAARRAGEPAVGSQDLALQAATTRVQFDFLADDAAPQDHAVVELVATEPGLDFALLRLAPAQRAPLRLRKAPLRRARGMPLRERVNLLQHPNGEAMRLGFRNNFVVCGDERWLSYLTDTHGGSSGSPVCDDAWSVVALHCGYRDITGARVQLDGIHIKTENYGVPIAAILAWLAAHRPEVHAQIEAGQR